MSRQDLLFQPNPPNAEEYLQKLFHNREDPREYGLRQLRAAETSDQIYAVYGDSRSGKSHLARVLLIDLKDDFTIAAINANTLGSARQALQTAYVKLWDILAPITETVEHAGGLQRNDVLEDWKPFFASLLPLVEENRTSLKLTVSSTLRDKLSLKLGLKALGADAGIETTHTKGVTIEIDKPSDSRLARLLAEMVDVLWYALSKRVLIFFDDLDLLERNSEKEATQLLGHLSVIAERPNAAIMTSTRAHFQIREKRLLDFVHLERADAGFLQAVYEKHCEHLNAGQPVFEADCLQALIEMSAGRVGVFLRFARRLMMHANAWKGTLATRANLDAWLSTELRSLAGSPETADLMKLIIEMVERNQMESEAFSAAAEGLARDSDLAYLVLVPGVFGGLRINPHAARVIKALLAAR